MNPPVDNVKRWHASRRPSLREPDNKMLLLLLWRHRPVTLDPVQHNTRHISSMLCVPGAQPAGIVQVTACLAFDGSAQIWSPGLAVMTVARFI